MERGKRGKKPKPSYLDVPVAEGQRVIRLRKDRNDRGAGVKRQFRPASLEVGDWVWRWDGWYAQAIHINPRRWECVLGTRLDGSPVAIEVDGLEVCWQSDCRACGASHAVWRAISTRPKPSYCRKCVLERRKMKKVVDSAANIIAKSASNEE